MSKHAQWLALGFPTVCVIPPGSELSPESEIKPTDMGKAPGLKGRDGKWHGYAFLQFNAKEATAALWDKWGANVGIKAANFPGLDIDVKSPALRDVVLKLAGEHLGPAPRRSTVEPRALLMYACDEPFTKMKLIAKHKDEAHVVEFLAHGQQYLVAGTHPSGAEYRWDTQPEPAALTKIDAAKVERFFEALQARLEKAGIEVQRIGRGSSPTAAAQPQENLQAPSIEELQRIVDMIPHPAEIERDYYVQMAHAVKAAGGDEALSVFTSWAERWEGGTNTSEEIETRYAGCSGPYRVGWTWLQEQAEVLGGWNSAQEDFEADPNAVAPTPAPTLPEDTTDELLSDYLLPAMRERVAFAVPAERWYVWEGQRWQHAGAHTITRGAVAAELKATARKYRDLAAQNPDKAVAKAQRAEARKLESSTTEGGVLNKLGPKLLVDMAEFDADPYMLNTPGGVVNLKTGEVLENTPELMFTHRTGVAPKRGPHPLWDAFLHDLTGGDDELRVFLRRLLGYCLTGSMEEKVLPYVWGGESDTGKSTFVNTVRKIFGTYASVVPPDVFLKTRGDRIPAELAQLTGVRLVTATEPPLEKPWDEEKVKQITGGDSLKVRGLYEKPFDLTPQFKIIMVGNQEPELSHVDSAMLRRIRIVPMNHPVPREKQIADLTKRMVEEEGPAILQWMIDGCMEWQREGLPTPAAVEEQTAEYARGEDTLGQWLSEQCELGVDYQATQQALYESYSQWCRARDIRTTGGSKLFGKQLRGIEVRHGLRKMLVTRARVAGYTGVRLRPLTTEDFA